MNEAFPVLIVDDNEQLRMVLKLQLKRFGLICHEARNGLEALELATKAYYDLILMDLSMPFMDGFTFTSRLREHQSLSQKRSKIIATTGQSDSNECRRKGFDGFLQKPVLLQDIKRLIEPYLDLASRDRVTP